MEGFNLGPTIMSIIVGVASTVNGVIAALVPYGTVLAGTLLLLGIVALGAAFITGGVSAMTPRLWSFTGISAGTLWAIREWDWLVGLSNATAGTILNAMGIAGIAGMFTGAQIASDRLAAEVIGLSMSAPIASTAQSIAAAITSVVVAVGLSMPALLASLATVMLLLGSAVSPVILPALAVGFLRNIGFGVIQFQVFAVVHIAIQGLIARVLTDQVTALIRMPTAAEGMTYPMSQTLLVVAVFSVLLSFSGMAVARAVTSGVAGGLGAGSITGTVGRIAGSAYAAGRIAGSVSSAAYAGGRMAAGAARGAAAGGGRQAGSASAGGGRVAARASGSAFR